jgi:hypothetical protein
MSDRPEPPSERDRAIRAVLLGLGLGIALVIAARRPR